MVEPKTSRRIAHLLKWYPANWRERYGEEFAAVLEQDFSETPRSYARTFNVVSKGLHVRARNLASANVSMRHVRSNYPKSLRVTFALVIGASAGIVFGRNSGDPWYLTVIFSLVYFEFVFGMSMRRQPARSLKSEKEFSLRRTPLTRSQKALIGIPFVPAIGIMVNVLIGSKTVTGLIALGVLAILFAVYFGWIWRDPESTLDGSLTTARKG